MILFVCNNQDVCIYVLICFMAHLTKTDLAVTNMQ